MATKNERIVTIRLLPLYCRNSARYEAPPKPSTSPRTRKTQKPSSTIPIPRGNKVETHITQSSTEVRRWNQPPLPLVDSISPRSFPPFFIANGKTKKALERGEGVSWCFCCCSLCAAVKLTVVYRRNRPSSTATPHLRPHSLWLKNETIFTTLLFACGSLGHF